MSLDGKLWKFLTKKRDKKIARNILLVGLAVSIPLATLDYQLDKREINRIFAQAGGNTKSDLSLLQKVDYIRSQPSYQPTNRVVEYFNSIRR